jgi:hypothetical protein
MYNSTNTVVCFNEKDGNLYLRLRAMSHTIHAAKSEQNDGKVSFTDEASVTIVLCLHVLIAHRIFINFGYVDYFQRK